MPLFTFRAKKVVDPICGKQVDPGASIASTEYGSRTFHFCSVNCFGTFQQDPSRYAR